MKRLIQIGFDKAGEWKKNASGTGIECCLHAYEGDHNVLYCFVCEQSVLYVGKTAQALKRRMYGYQNPAPTQSTNINGNKEISALLDAGKQVEIYALPDNGLLHFGVFHINLAAGLEDSIIQKLTPKWNQTGTTNK